MFAHLPNVCLIKITSQHPEIGRYVRLIFGGWLISASPETVVDIELSLHYEPQLPERPALSADFVDTRFGNGRHLGDLSVFHTGQDRMLLYFFDGAVANLTLARNRLAADITLNDRLLHSTRFEDVLFTTLAPLLRRLECYLLHAFATAHRLIDGEREGVLVVGPTHSGKTTTGLNLLLNGWELLANDAVALTRHDETETVIGVATPGFVSVRPQTFDLLPRLRQWVPDTPETSVSFSAAQLGGGYRIAPVPIRHIYFSEIHDRATTAVTPLNRAVSLALLLEESLDKWDERSLSPHTSLLSQLVRQARCYHLQLGRDIEQIPHVIEANQTRERSY